MNKRVMVVAPHPDDETLGCGGTLLRHRGDGDSIHWLIVTGISEQGGFAGEVVARRRLEIESVTSQYGFQTVHDLAFPTTCLDATAMNAVVGAIGRVFSEVQPEIVYLPFRGDVHTDHRVVFDAALACTKWFRYPSIKRVMAYETLSETGFGSYSESTAFVPNVFVDIERTLERKLEILSSYASELGEFPFPRSIRAVRALAEQRGSSAGAQAAEAFLLLKEIL